MNVWRSFAICAVVLSLCVGTVQTAVAETEESGEHMADEHGEEAGDKDVISKNPLEWDPDLAIFTAIVFLILLAILAKFAWKPIIAGLEKREQSIADDIDAANQASEKAQATLGQYQEQLAAASDEVKELLAEARRDAEATKDRIVAEAKEAAQRERERAVADINAAKNAALRELSRKTVDEAISLASVMLRKEIDPAAHQQLIQEALEQFPSRN